MKTYIPFLQLGPMVLFWSGSPLNQFKILIRFLPLIGHKPDLRRQVPVIFSIYSPKIKTWWPLTWFHDNQTIFTESSLDMRADGRHSFDKNDQLAVGDVI